MSSSPPSSPRPLIVFDCDGVLVDSERLLQGIDIDMITALGWPITVAEIHEQHLGRTAADFAANVERHIGRPVPDGFLRQRSDRFLAALEDELEPVPGVIAVLDRLDRLGYVSCVASSGSHEKMRSTLGRTGLYQRFEGRIFSAADVSHGKPAPELFLHAAAQSGFAAEQCIVVEDSPAGVEAARRAGMHSIGYAADTPRTLLRAADIVIDVMTELPRAIATLHP